MRLRTIFTAAIIILATYTSAGRTFDSALCQHLLEHATGDDNATFSRQDYGTMAEQCSIMQDRLITETQRIKQIPDKDSRREAANAVNASIKNEYPVYNAMVRILRRALEQDDAKQTLGRGLYAESSLVVARNAYINQMFTIFRSRYDL